MIPYAIAYHARTYIHNQSLEISIKTLKML